MLIAFQRTGAVNVVILFFPMFNGKMTKLVTVVENMVSDRDIDDNGQEDAQPNWDIVRIKANKAPISTDPTPELGFNQSQIRYRQTSGALTAASPNMSPFGLCRIDIKTTAGIIGPPKQTIQYTQAYLRKVLGLAL